MTPEKTMKDMTTAATWAAPVMLALKLPPSMDQNTTTNKRNIRIADKEILQILHQIMKKINNRMEDGGHSHHISLEIKNQGSK